MSIYLNKSNDLVITKRLRITRPLSGKSKHLNVIVKNTMNESSGSYYERTLIDCRNRQVYCMGYEWNPSMTTILKNRYRLPQIETKEQREYRKLLKEALEEAKVK